MSKAIGLGILGVGLVLGCGPAATGGGTTAASSMGVGPGDWRTDDVPPARTMVGVAGTLGRAGFAPTGEEGRAFIIKGRTETAALRVEADRCYYFVTTASRELLDLDSYLFQPSGVVVDQDRREDNHPTIRHCPTESGTLYLVFEAYDGNGLLYWVSFAGPAGAEVPLTDLFPDVEQNPEAETGATGDTESMAERARVFSDIMMGRGFAVAAEDPAVHLAAGAAETRTLELTADKCYTFAAYGGNGATDIDLYLTAPDGQETALDEDAALDAYVQWCPVVDGQFTLRISMAGGAGDAVLYRLEASADRVGGLDGLWLGTRRPPGPTHRSLDEGAAQMKGRLEGLGYRLDDAATLSGEAQQMGIRTHTLQLTADKCHVFGAVGGPDVADVDLFLYDRQGNEVAADEALAASALIQVCPQQNETFRLDVAMRGGSGPYRVLRGASPAVGAEAARGLDTVARTRLRAVVDRIHMPELTPLGGPQTAELRERGVRRYQNDLQQGSCYLFVAVGAQSVIDIDLYVLDAAGDTVTRDDQPDAMPTVQFCPTASGSYSTDVRLVEGSGSFTLLQYRTPSPASGAPDAGGTP
jgi:hypothetical protein